MASQSLRTPSGASPALAILSGNFKLEDQPAPSDSPESNEISLEVVRLSDELAQVSRRLGYMVEAGAEPGHRPVRNENYLELADRVAHAILARQQRMKYFATELFADPAWDMLLDIFLSELLQRRSTVSSLCIASQVPPTTALRWIRSLTDRGMFLRRPDPLDGRRIFVELSETARTALHSYFDSISA